MTLVDTSVWIDHFRSSEPELVRLLTEQQVVTHPAVIGELACGLLADRNAALRDLGELPQVAAATHEEALIMIEAQSLMGRGIGYVDLLLLASCAVTPGTRLWTRDARLASVASDLGLAAIGA